MIRFLHITILILFTGLCSYGQTADDVNNKIKGMYMYQFAKNVNWANKEHAKGDFEIGIFGEKELFDQISGKFSGKLIGSQPIKVKYFSAASNVTNCHILYIAKKNNNHVTEFSKKFKSEKTLIVSNGKGQLTNGAVISFIIKDNKIAYELSKTNANKKDLEIGQMLIKLAASTI